jgi:hypothetical protein
MNILVNTPPRKFVIQINSRIVLLAGLLTLCSVSAFGTTLDVVFYDNRFGTINDVTGAFTQVGTLPISASAGIASMNGLIYLEDLGTDLYIADPLTGASSLVGATGMSTASGAFAGDSYGLFEVDYASNLYSVNPETGKAEFVGATGLVANNGSFDTSLSADGPYLYYTAGHGGAADELYVINTETGVATDLGSTGVTGIAGSAIVGSELELFQYGQSVNYIYSSAVGLNQFSRGPELGAQIIDGGAVITLAPAFGAQQPDAAPEPGSWLLLLTGILSLAMTRGRRYLPPYRYLFIK